MKQLKKLALGAAGVAALGGAAVAIGVSNADASTTALAATGYSTASPNAAQGASNHTPVTGDEAAKVTAAVVAKDSAATVTSVVKDADGSYDVAATKAGATVRYEVSADLATITMDTKGGHGRGGGGSADTPVTGDEATKAAAAVTAKDSTVTVTSVRKDPDGSYDVLGTKAGANVMYDVSADLATVTQNQHANADKGSSGSGTSTPSSPGTSSGTSTS